MPQEERFINPYRFVDKQILSRDIVRELEKSIGHESFQGMCGSITAELLNLTPLAIGGRKDPHQGENIDDKSAEKSFVHNPEDNHPLIPGSSLKGCISTIYEILAGERACKSIFGQVARNDNHKGHIFFSDAKLNAEKSPDGVEDANKLTDYTTVLSSPRKRHEAFYKDRRQVKLYHHQSDVMTPRGLHRDGPRNSRVQSKIIALPPYCCFRFTVHFENINQTQFAAFLKSLFLEKGLCHKLGGGKPLGAGTIHIKPIFMEICPDRSRYFRGEDNLERFENTQDCLVKIEELCQSIQFTSDLQKMLLWNPNDTNSYKYPSNGWFHSEDHSRVPLKSIDDVYSDPINLQASQQDIDAKWQKMQEIQEEKKKKTEEEEKRKKEEEKFKSLPPIEKAMILWQKEDLNPEKLEDPSKFGIEGLDTKECQKKMLEYLRDHCPELCEEKKSYHKKEIRKAKKNKKNPPETLWSKWCKIADDVELKDFDPEAPYEKIVEAWQDKNCKHKMLHKTKEEFGDLVQNLDIEKCQKYMIEHFRDHCQQEHTKIKKEHEKIAKTAKRRKQPEPITPWSKYRDLAQKLGIENF